MHSDEKGEGILPGPEKNVVRYHKRYALFQAVLFLIVVGAFLALIIRQNLQQEKLATEKLSQHFSHQVLIIDEEFVHLQDKIIALKMAAEENLFQTRENAVPMHNLFRFVKDTPDGKAFHLDEIAPPYKKEHLGNLTGDGSIQGRSPNSLREISMALSLCDDFDRMAKSIPHLTWIYYYSKDNFALYYPWTLSQDTRFEKEAYKSSAWTLGLPENNQQREPYWTEIYFDAVGKGLMVSCLAPIYDQDRFLGVVGGDLSVNHLNKIIKPFELNENAHFVIYDQFDNILAAPGLISANDKQITKMEKVLPATLAAARSQLASTPQGLAQNFNGWRLVKKDLSHKPFTALYYEPMPSTMKFIVGNIGYGAFSLLGGLILLLIFFLIVSHLGFIRPSEMLVRHILNQSEGSGLNPVRWVPKPWQPWFRMITRVFNEKKALTDNLEAKNLELIERTRFVESMLNLSPDIIYIYNLTDKKNVFINKGIQTVLGYSVAEIQKMGDHLIPILMHPDDFKVYLDKIIPRYATAKDNERISHEYRMKHKNGNWCFLESTELIYKRQPDGSPYQIFGVIHDVTERKLAEEEKDKLETQLRQSQKMEAIGQLAGGVAHDFNNMLSVINGYSDMLLKEMEHSDPKYQNLNEIKKAGERSAALTQQLLAFARKQAINPQVMDLNEAVAGMLNMLQRLIGENIKLIWEPAANLWKIKMDISQINQIMANLLVNARDAIHGAGKIQIETSNVELDESYCMTHPDSIPGKFVVLSVTDNGHGIEEKLLEHIFEPFFTSKKIGKGTGLGLATVFGIVKQNNGFINVSSELGKGSTFKIYLPQDESQNKFKNEKPEKTNLVKGSETILLVEDELTLLEFIKKMLEEQGYTVLAASNPNEAITIAKEKTADIHLLLTDVIMPEMSGLILSEKISEIYPEIKCIFISGYNADIISKDGVIDEGIYFLQKPFTSKELSQILREALS